MKVYHSAESFDYQKATAVTIGTFDGMHIGHKKIIDRLVARAKEKNLIAVILTFFPHPRMVLQQDDSMKLIHTIDERVQILKQTQADALIIHPFTKSFSRLTAGEYVRSFLCKHLNSNHLIIGYDHRFGRNRNSNIEDLIAYGNELNYQVEEISKQEISEVVVSSTKIREAILQGNIQLANRYLGHPFILTGKVVKGKAIGRTLNYPTANLHIAEAYKIIPKNGVYIVRSTIAQKEYYGMMNIGTNPTLNGKHQSIEAHFFDTSLDLYHTTIQIALLDRVRDEKKFDSILELKTAMQQDEKIARAFKNRCAK